MTDTSAQGVPRATLNLVGHRAAEAALLDAYRSGRMPHAWLLGGPKGIGKATLAYRMARFVLAHPDPASDEVRHAQDLSLADHPVITQVAVGTCGDLLVLERQLNEKGALKTSISVDDARRALGFFGETASGEGWRICIVDAVDDLNANSANALLKALEEPPARTLFILVSHAPGRVLPTIRSRCRTLQLRPLPVADVIDAVNMTADGEVDGAQARAAADASDGSVGMALELLGEGQSLKLSRRTTELLDQLPVLHADALHDLGDMMGSSDRAALSAFSNSIEHWITARLRAGRNADLPRLARLSQVWEKILQSIRDAETYNLERKPLVFSVFDHLAGAVR